jgi:hypothetical protein
MKPAYSFTAIAALCMTAAAAGCYFLALQTLQTQIRQAIAPNGEIRSLRVSPFGVEIQGLRIWAPPSGSNTPSSPNLKWPAREELRAERVLVDLDPRSLISGTTVIRRVRLEKAYMPMVRAPHRLHFLPSLLERHRPAAEPSTGAALIALLPGSVATTVARPRGASSEPVASAPSNPRIRNTTKPVRIERVEFVDAQIDFFDTTVGEGAHPVPLREISGELDDLAFPRLDEPVSVQLQGIIPWGKQSGRITLKGQLTPATLDSSLQFALRDVPLGAVQPYFVKASNLHVQGGTLQLDLDWVARQRHVQAPGRMVLQNMELVGNGSFAGLTREALLNLLADRKRRLELQFILDGSLDDPHFSLNEQLYVRVGTALADALGLSVENLGQSIGGVASDLANTIRSLIRR